MRLLFRSAAYLYLQYTLKIVENWAIKGSKFNKIAILGSDTDSYSFQFIFWKKVGPLLNRVKVKKKLFINSMLNFMNTKGNPILL